VQAVSPMIELLTFVAAYLVFGAVSLAAAVVGYAIGAWIGDRW